MERRIDSCGRLLAHVLLLVSSVRHLAKFILFGELAGEDAKVLDEGLAGVDDGRAGSDGPVGLDAEEEVGRQGVRNLERI